MAGLTVATSSCMAATAVMIPRLPTTSSSPCLPPRFSISPAFSTYFKRISVSRTPSRFQTKASSTDDSIDSGEVFTDLKEKWDAVENKSTVLLYGGGALLGVWLSSILIGAVNSVPVLPKIMELVGLGYSGWFVYRYLLFKSSRKELSADIETLKKKIAGSE